MNEKLMQEALIELARMRGWLVYHTWKSINSPAGFPDLVLVRDDRLIFAELKGPRGRMTPAQATWIEAIRRTGTEAYVWYPDDYDTAIAILNTPRDLKVMLP